MPWRCGRRRGQRWRALLSEVLDLVEAGVIGVVLEVELKLGRGASGSHAGVLCREVEVAQDRVDGRGVFDVADTVHLVAAAGANEDVQPKDSFQ